MSALTSSFATNVFGNGSYATILKNTTNSPKPLLIATPTEIGEFPLLIFLHGFILYNFFYSQLLQHVASHGFIVIAPQLYSPLSQIFSKNATDEINSAAAIANWLSKEALRDVLPQGVKPNLSKLALSGHSRGGKVAFALALKKEMTTSKFSALIGVDPVDGTIPRLITKDPHSFNLDMPVMVIGSGLFSLCNPNQEDFFKKCTKPACHFVAKGYGHLDILNDDINWFIDRISDLCRHGKNRWPMRRFTGGVIVAFLKAYLNGDNTDLIAIKECRETAPEVTFERPPNCTLETVGCLDQATSKYSMVI